MNNSYYESMSAEQAIRELAAMGIKYDPARPDAKDQPKG